MKSLIILSDLLSVIGFKKESQAIFGLNQDADTYELGGLDNGISGFKNDLENNTVEDTGINEYFGSKLIDIEERSKRIWSNSVIKKDHEIIKVLNDFYEKVMLISEGESMVNISSVDLQNTAGIFKFYGQDFKNRKDRPHLIIKSGKSITPVEVMSVITMSVNDFLLTIPSNRRTVRLIEDLNSWTYAIYEQYADFYYQNVDSSRKDRIISDIAKRIDRQREMSSGGAEEMS